MNYIIVDLEATCLENKTPEFISEIIEIGAVKVNEVGEIIDTFECFVKPTINPILSDFCKTLTSITQKNVDTGLERKTALNNFIDFCGKDCTLLSWGGYDKNQLNKELRKCKLPTYITDNHVNLKEKFANILSLPKQCGMAKALNIAKIKLTGTHHRGIDDAKNITKIFQKYLDDFKNEIKN